MHLVAQLYVKSLYCFVSITLFLTVFKNINSVQYKTKITSLYFEWPWFISRLIYVTHYMYINWRRKKNNWVIFCRPVTLNLLPTIHCKVKNPPKITGLCPYYADHWRSRTVPKHFHMLQKNSPLHRHIAVSINTKHIWVTISCFSALYFRVPFDGSYVSSQPVFQYIPVYRWQSTTNISIVSI